MRSSKEVSNTVGMIVAVSLLRCVDLVSYDFDACFVRSLTESLTVIFCPGTSFMCLMKHLFFFTQSRLNPLPQGMSITTISTIVNSNESTQTSSFEAN